MEPQTKEHLQSKTQHNSNLGNKTKKENIYLSHESCPMLLPWEVLNTLSSPVPLLLMMDGEGSKSKRVIKVLVETGQEGPREWSLTCILDASEGLNHDGNLKLKRC